MQALQPLRAGGRLVTLLVLTLVCIPLYRFSRTGRGQRRVARLWFRATNCITGLQTHLSGRVQHDGPVLYVANHISYLDILLLGASLDAVFVAKSDIAGWPLFGYLARLGPCIFVSRKATRVRDEAGTIRQLLVSGRNVILFPEGTTGEGGKLLPFRSALLAALEGLPQMRVQPVSIAYPDLENGGADRTLAWYGDMALLPHLWLVLKRAFAPARLHFLPALRAADYADRKLLTAVCHARIAQGLAHLLAAHPATSSGLPYGLARIPGPLPHHTERANAV